MALFMRNEREAEMRKRIYDIIEVAESGDVLSKIYDVMMMILIVLSLIPLTMKHPAPAWHTIDKICVSVFIVDYVLRLITADFKYKDKARFVAYMRYPFSFMAIIDLLSILPSVIPVNRGLKVLRLLRMTRAFRVFRVFRALRYSRNIRIIVSVIKRSKDSLIAVCVLAGAYILISALVIFNVEPDSFRSFFDAVYWATVSLTTVGYGDIYPVSTTGRIIAMISSIFGIAIVALPAGIITAGYLEEMSDNKAKHEG